MGKRVICLVLAVGGCWIMSPAGHGATLVGYWAFEGNGLDSSDNHNDATANGDVSYAARMYGQAVVFDGAADYLEIPNSSGIQLRGGKEFSVAAYVNADTLNHQNILLHGVGCASWASWFLGVAGCEPDAALYENHFVFGIRTGNYSAYSHVKAEAVTGEWVHIAVTFDGTTMRMYTNGEMQDSAAGSLPYDNLENLYIGGDAGCSGRSWFTGLVDEVCILNRAMSEGQVQALAGGEVPTWLKANKPIPADGAAGVTSAMLQWTKGDTAALHDIYLGTDPNLTTANLVASARPSAFYYHSAGFVPGTTYYWRVDEIEKDGVTIYPGDVWSFVVRDVKAYYPTPADGENAVLPTATLTWMPGSGALEHHVYFGDSLDAVGQGAAETDQGVQAVADVNFAPGVLDSLTTYYWRVDEILAGSAVAAGPVWSFTTARVIDNFESYTDEEGSTIYESWIDGLTTQENGSTVGYMTPPFAEQTIVHDANQSMPFDYNNVDSPFYSEAKREFGSAQDWTADGADTLVLYVRGKWVNAQEPLFIAVEDSSGHVGTVIHPDPAVVTVTRWIEWQIPFSEFTASGVNMARVKKLYIRVGDKTATEAGGKGLIFIDDILLTKP